MTAIRDIQNKDSENTSGANSIIVAEGKIFSSHILLREPGHNIFLDNLTNKAG